MDTLIEKKVAKAAQEKYEFVYSTFISGNGNPEIYPGELLVRVSQSLNNDGEHVSIEWNGEVRTMCLLGYFSNEITRRVFTKFGILTLIKSEYVSLFVHKNGKILIVSNYHIGKFEMPDGQKVEGSIHVVYDDRDKKIIFRTKEKPD